MPKSRLGEQKFCPWDPWKRNGQSSGKVVAVEFLTPTDRQTQLTQQNTAIAAAHCMNQA